MTGDVAVFSDLYCTMEVDSFGLFVNKAKTRVYRYTTEPKWNEVRMRPALIVHRPWALVRYWLYKVFSPFSRHIKFAKCHEYSFSFIVSFDVLVEEEQFIFFVCLFQEFEIELEGSQTLRLLCYDKSYNKTKMSKEDGESTDRIIGKGQIVVWRFKSVVSP